MRMGSEPGEYNVVSWKTLLYCRGKDNIVERWLFQVVYELK